MSTTPPPGGGFTAPAAAPVPEYAAPAPTKPGKNGLGITAIILGGVGIVLAFIPFVGFFGGVLGFVGLVLGIIGLFMKGRSRTTAAIGTGLSALALILSIVMGIVYASVFVNAFNDSMTIDKPAVVEEGDGAEAPAAEGEAETSDAGTLENPAPFGSTVTVSTFEGPVWEVTAAAPNLDATADVKAANQFNSDPAAGNVYAILPVTIKFIGEGKGGPFDLQFTYVGPSGQVYDGSYVDMEGQLSDVSELTSGASATGNVVIEIPAEGADTGAWGVEYILSEDVIYFGNPK